VFCVTETTVTETAFWRFETTQY